MKYKKKIKSLVNSFGYAFQGIWSSFKSERNMKIHVFIMILVVLLGIFLHISVTEWMICVILFALVIGAELFNTSIEAVVDMISLEKSSQAKLAKDVSAGAVLVFAIASIIVGLIIFVPKIIDILV